MPRASDALNIRLISKVSSLYYNQNYSQKEIANRLLLSRPKVSRLLKQARERGIVQITVVPPNGNFMDTESVLEKKFGLQEVIIVDIEGSDAKTIKRQIGTAAANYLHRSVSQGDLIGVTWGTTLEAMVDAVQPKPMKDLHIVQALGGVGPPEAKAHAADLSRRLSRLLGSKLTLLPAPGIVSSAEAKQVLLSDPQVSGALDFFSKLDTLYVGLGALSTNPVLVNKRTEIPASFYKEVIESEAVGDIALRFFDNKGNEVKTHLKDCTIGISPKKIKEVSTVVGIAGGPGKINVIRGALNGSYIDVLITDHQTADELLEE
jgi:DNA-binding transcriptional regulator LsrR (DeoR family)